MSSLYIALDKTNVLFCPMLISCFRSNKWLIKRSGLIAPCFQARANVNSKIISKNPLNVNYFFLSHTSLISFACCRWILALGRTITAMPKNTRDRLREEIITPITTVAGSTGCSCRFVFSSSWTREFGGCLRWIIETRAVEFTPNVSARRIKLRTADSSQETPLCKANIHVFYGRRFTAFFILGSNELTFQHGLGLISSAFLHLFPPLVQPFPHMHTLSISSHQNKTTFLCLSHFYSPWGARPGLFWQIQELYCCLRGSCTGVCAHTHPHASPHPPPPSRPRRRPTQLLLLFPPPFISASSPGLHIVTLKHSDKPKKVKEVWH